MKRKLFKFLTYTLIGGSVLAMQSCTDDEYVDTAIQFNGKLFHTVAATNSGALTLGYDQVDISDINNTLPFNSNPFSLPSGDMTHTEIVTSADGLKVYVLNGTNGNLFKYNALGGQNYMFERNLNITYALGTAHPNVIRIDDEYVLLTHLLNDAGQNKLRIALVDLENLSLFYNEELELPADASGATLTEVNSAIVLNSKVYLGVKKTNGGTYSPIETLVVDYPTLTNPRYITSNYTQPIVGFTSGEYIPTMHIDEMYSIFQIVNVEENQGETHIVKINEDIYNPSFNFNLDLLLGEPTYAKGWFYVGNGVGYVPYLRKNLGTADSNNWALARVDLYNHTALQLNLPGNLNFNNCRQAVAKDGKLYLPIALPGQPGNIYVFDATNPSPVGFIAGANLEAVSGGTYIGIY